MVFVDTSYIEERFGVKPRALSHSGGADNASRRADGARAGHSLFEKSSGPGVEATCSLTHVGNTDDAKHGSSDEVSNSGSCAVGDDRNAAWSKFLRLISVRDRSSVEVKRKLADADFSEEAIASTLDRARRSLLLDDSRFADSFIRSRIAMRKGLPGIEADLAAHGIAVIGIPGFPEEYVGGRSEFDRACECLAKRPPHSKNLWKSAYGKLVRAGYDHDVAYRAATWFSDREGANGF